MNEGRTHFADDATLTYIYTLEARVQLLANALDRIANPTESTYGNPEFIARAALTEAGLNEQKGGVMNINTVRRYREYVFPWVLKWYGSPPYKGGWVDNIHVGECETAWFAVHKLATIYDELRDNFNRMSIQMAIAMDALDAIANKDSVIDDGKTIFGEHGRTARKATIEINRLNPIPERIEDLLVESPTHD